MIAWHSTQKEDKSHSSQGCRINCATEQTFIQDFSPLLHTSSPSQAEPIKYVIDELVRNVLEHSESSTGAFVCAQFFPKTKRVSIGVADAGVGIKETISLARVVKTDGEAIKLALTAGVTGYTTDPRGTARNAGAGLFFVKSISKVNKNFFVLCSGTGMYKLLKTPKGRGISLYPDPNDDRHSFRDNIPRWPGTAVGVDITLENNQTFSQLLGLLRQIYTVDVDSRIQARKARFV